MNKKINTYMMAAMMAVVSPAIMGQTASDGVKVICNDVVQKGDSIYIDAVVTVSGDAVNPRLGIGIAKGGASFYFGERTYPPESI